MNDDTSTGVFLIDRIPLQGAPNGAHKPNGNLGLSVNCFTPGDRQAPISIVSNRPIWRNLGSRKFPIKTPRGDGIKEDQK
jgi:hypothetical protein